MAPRTPASTQQPPLDPELSMADLWRQMPTEPGLLGPVIAHQLEQCAPLHLAQSVHVGRGSALGGTAATTSSSTRPRPYRDEPLWWLIKSGVQLAFALMAVLFVLEGGELPLMAGSYAGTALLLVVAVVVADRQRFLDRDPAFEIVECLVPRPSPVAGVRAHEPRPGPLATLAEQMASALPARIDVT